MPKKIEIVVYNASKKEVEDSIFCIKRGVAFCMRRTAIDEDLYFIEKYDPNNPLIPGTFMKEDPKGPETYANRSKLGCLKAWKKVFEFYSTMRGIIEEKENPKPAIVVTEKEQIDKEKTLSYNPKREKPGKNEDYGIDLFQMIKECEEEKAELAISDK